MTSRSTTRLRLEPIGPQHAGDLFRLFQDPAVAEWYGTWSREKAEREAARIGLAWAEDGVHKWMAYHRETGELVGRGGLSRAHVDGEDCLELGWALRRAFWGAGYATEIGRAGLEAAAGPVVSFTEVHNHRSRAVMERLGFRYDRVFHRKSVPFALYRHDGRVPDEPRTKHERKADVLARLSAPVADAWVATADADRPALVPLTLAWVDDRIVLATAATTPAARNLVSHGTARLALGRTRDVVLIDARLERVLPAGEAGLIGAAYAEQNDWDPRTAGDGYVFLILRPERVQAWRELDEMPDRLLMRDGSWLV